jgi:hypothetical protein
MRCGEQEGKFMDAVRRSLVFLVPAGLIAAACHAPLDTDRQPVDTGTFGNTVLTLVCKRLSYLDSRAAHDAGTSATVDVAGNQYRDVCRLGLAPPSDAPVDLKALEARRDNLTPAVDAIFPEAFLPNLQTFLTSNDFLATYDAPDDVAIKAIDGLIGTLRLFAKDDQATAALERFGTRLGYRPIEPGLGAVRVAVNYPGLHDLLLSLSNAVTPGGSAKDEWDHLIAAAGYALRDAQVADDPTDSQRTSRLALDLLLTQSDLLGSPDKAIPLVRRDERGLAQVAVTAQNAPVAPFVDVDQDGYADTDSVGRFVDASGQPLDVPPPFQGAPDGTPPSWPKFDAAGRPVDANDKLIYDYVDIDKTVLAALSRDGVKLFDPSKGTAFDLLRGASALMGPRADATRTYDIADAGGQHETLAYRGYDLSQSALLDMAYGYLTVLKDPNIYDTLFLARTLVVDHEAETARLAEAVIQAARKGDAHPEAQIPADSPLWDDLIPVMRQIVNNPALTKALMKALEDPKVADLGTRFMNFMKYKDSFTYNNSTQAVTGAFNTLVDRTQLDQGANRSLFQRILLLINDSNHAQACNKANAKLRETITPLHATVATYNNACDLFKVDNLATFFVQSIAYSKDNQGRIICEDAKGQAFGGNTATATSPTGCPSGMHPQPKANFNYQWGGVNGLIGTLGGDGYLEGQTGIAGLRSHPTPQALGRILFLAPWPNTDNDWPNGYLSNIADPIKDKNGAFFIAKHNGSLPVWEKDNFYAQIQPVVQAFADNNQEQLFVDLLVVLNKHWASPQSIDTQTANPNGADYVWGSKAVTYEPLIIDMLADGSLMHALVDSAPVMNKVTIGTGNNVKAYPDIVQRAASYVLTPQAGLTNRAGQTTSTTADGKPVAQLSPWQVLADAYALKKARLDMSGAEGQAWTESVSEVIDVLARGDNVQGVGWRFRNPRMRGVTQALLNFLIVRIFVHDVNNDRQAWLTTDLPKKLEQTLANPLFAGMADFIISLEATPETRQQLEGLMVYLTNEVEFDQTFTTNLTSIGDLLQLALDDEDLAPIAHVAGEAIRPERGWLDAHLMFVKKARASDQNQALVQIARNLYTEHRPGHTAIGDVIDGISEVLRANPYTDLEQHYTAADYKSLLDGVANFLDENKRGLRKFVRIIQTRNVD